MRSTLLPASSVDSGGQGLLLLDVPLRRINCLKAFSDLKQRAYSPRPLVLFLHQAEVCRYLSQTEAFHRARRLYPRDLRSGFSRIHLEMLLVFSRLECQCSLRRERRSYRQNLVCDRERLYINNSVPQCLNTTENGSLSLDGDVSQASRQQEALRCCQLSPCARAKSDWVVLNVTVRMFVQSPSEFVLKAGSPF